MKSFLRLIFTCFFIVCFALYLWPPDEAEGLSEEDYKGVPFLLFSIALCLGALFVFVFLSIVEIRKKKTPKTILTEEGTDDLRSILKDKFRKKDISELKKIMSSSDSSKAAKEMAAKVILEKEGVDEEDIDIKHFF